MILKVEGSNPFIYPMVLDKFKNTCIFILSIVKVTSMKRTRWSPVIGHDEAVVNIAQLVEQYILKVKSSNLFIYNAYY